MLGRLRQRLCPQAWRDMWPRAGLALALLALLLVALLYVKCRLNVLLWYQDKYGEVEMNGAWGPDGGEGGL